MIDVTTAVSLERGIAIARDIVFVVGLPIVGWKARSWLQPVLAFFKRADGHMNIVESGLGTMEAGMKILLENHMAHIEKHLATLAKRSRPRRKTKRG